jgi:hypothetical protein
VPKAPESRYGGRRRRVAAAVVVLALVGAGIGLVISYGPRSQGTRHAATEAPLPGPNKSPAPQGTNSTIPQGTPCKGSSLSAHGGRQGGGFVGVADGTVILTNRTSSPCVLTGAPTVVLMNADGQFPLAVSENFAINTITSPVLVEPGQSAYLTVSWTNWCAPPPGPLQIVIMIHGNGWVIGDFNTPAFVPACIRGSRPSTICVTYAYGSGRSPTG